MFQHRFTLIALLPLVALATLLLVAFYLLLRPALLPLVALVTLLLVAFYVLLLPTIVMSANRLIAVDFEVKHAEDPHTHIWI